MNGIGSPSIRKSSRGSDTAKASSFIIVFKHSVNSCCRVPQMAEIGWHAKTVAKKKPVLQLQTMAIKIQLKILNRRPINIRR